MQGDSPGAPKELFPTDQTFVAAESTSTPREVYSRSYMPQPEEADSRTDDRGQDTSSGDRQGARAPYNQQEVVNKYIERLDPVLEDMADEFKSMGEDALQWQTEVIISLLELVPEQHELTFPLYLEKKDLQNKLVEPRRLEAEQLEESSGGGTNTSSASTIVRTQGAQARRRAWDHLVETFMSKVDPDIWKLIAHLQAVREWSVSGEVSANAFFVKGKMGLSITFGE